MRFKDKVIIISGGLGGIGLAAARRLASEGARVVLADLREAVTFELGPRAVVDCIAQGAPEALALACDVTDEQQVDAVVEETLKRFGRIDAVVNVAGMMLFKELRNLTAADWGRVLGVNLMGPVFFTRRALQHMSSGGAIVNVSSIHAIQTSPLVAPYAAAKAAVTSLTRSTAIEGKSKGIRANAVLPGAIDTPMLWSNPNIQSGAEAIDPGNVGRPQHVAAAIAFLASEEAAFISGSAFTVDGGRLACL